LDLFVLKGKYRAVGGQTRGKKKKQRNYSMETNQPDAMERTGTRRDSPAPLK
jgi:hypothetical protein